MDECNVKKIPRWLADEVNLLREMYPKYTIKECAIRLGRTEKAIKAKAHSLRLINVWFMKYDREAIFNLLTDLSRPESCYLLGMIWADGTINSSGFSLTLVKKDMDHIDWMMAQLGTLSTRLRAAGVGRQEARIYSMGYKKLQNWMIDRGYKTKSKGTPDRLVREIPPNNLHYFFRGWFDGDGHWGVGANNGGSYRSRWSVAGAINQDWSTIENLLKDMDLPYAIIKTPEGNGGSSWVRITNTSDIVTLGEYIYAGYPNDGIGLPRKYAKYLTIKANQEKSLKTRTEREQHIALFKTRPDLSVREKAALWGLPYQRVRYIAKLVHAGGDYYTPAHQATDQERAATGVKLRGHRRSVYTID